MFLLGLFLGVIILVGVAIYVVQYAGRRRRGQQVEVRSAVMKRLSEILEPDAQFGPDFITAPGHKYRVEAATKALESVRDTLPANQRGWVDGQWGAALVERHVPSEAAAYLDARISSALPLVTGEDVLEVVTATNPSLPLTQMLQNSIPELEALNASRFESIAMPGSGEAAEDQLLIARRDLRQAQLDARMTAFWANLNEAEQQALKDSKSESQLAYLLQGFGGHSNMLQAWARLGLLKPLKDSNYRSDYNIAANAPNPLRGGTAVGRY